MNMKKITSLVLTLLLVLAMAAPAFASGVTGTITITPSEADGTAPGTRTFAAYKILDVTLSGSSPSYSVPDSMKAFYASYLTLDFTGNTPGQINQKVTQAIAALTTSAQMEAFAEAAVAFAKDPAKGNITPEVISGGTPKTVPYGYYVIEQTSAPAPGSRVSAVMIDTTNPNATIKLKADTPDIDKEIVTASGDEDADDVSIGDTVHYKITGKVPDMTGFETQYYYTITDTLSKGLTFIGGTDASIPEANRVKVVLDGATLVRGTAVPKTGDYHVVETPVAGGETAIRIVFHDFLQYKTKAGVVAGDPIVVTYSAILNENAVVGESGNPNTARLIYSNNPGNEGSGTPGDDPPDDNTVVGKSPEHKTLTFTTAIELTKVDAANPATKLAGAKFKLEGTTMNKVLVWGDVFTLGTGAEFTYWLLKDGTYTTTAPITGAGGTEALYQSTTDKYKKETKTVVQETAGTVAAEGWTDADGLLKFTGLSAGTYTLTELISPLGYNLLTDPLTITIGVTLPDPVSSGAEKATWTTTVGSVVGGIIKFNVENNKGVELPGTGGIGTTLFTIGGIVLMGAAVLLLVLRRKKQTKA